MIQKCVPVCGSKCSLPVLSSTGASRGSVPAGLQCHGGVPAAHQRCLTGEGQGLLPQTQVRYATLHYSPPVAYSLALRIFFTLKGEFTLVCCISKQNLHFDCCVNFSLNYCQGLEFFKVRAVSFIQTSL